MDIDDLKEIAELITDKQIIRQDYLERLLHFFDKNNLTNNISCRYLLMKNKSDSIREHDFLKFIIQNIIFYVLTYEEYHGLQGLNAADLIRRNTDLVFKAISTFQRKNEKTGEVGELILFLLLESQGISQLVSKMRLKTSTEWPIHGTDAIHIKIENDEMILHYGEAKMYNNFSSALNSAIDSLINFDDKQEDVEINLISANIDRSKFEHHAGKIIDYLDPYNENKEQLKTTQSIFIGYDWDLLADLKRRGNRHLSDYLKDEYVACQEDYSNQIKEKVSSSEVHDKTFDFYVLPFRSVEDFRNSFLEML